MFRYNQVRKEKQFMKINNITKIYHNKYNIIEAISDITLEFNLCGLISILGPSGSGKTTLLNIISGKDKNYTGEIIDNNNIEIIEQEFMLFESLSVFDNLTLVASTNKVIHILKEFQMLNYKDKIVKQLSNGQKKRVQIMRSLLVEPDILLCDEPTAALDYENSQFVLEMLSVISQKKCVIMVTHEVALAEMYSTRIIKIDKGKIQEDKLVKETTPLHTQLHSHSRKSFMEHVKFVLRNIKSRWMLSLLSLFVLFVSVIGVYASLNMYSTVEETSKNDLTNYYGKNIIALTPHQKKVDSKDFWTHFDNITYQDINKILSEIPEIQAYTCGIDRANYAYIAGKKESPYQKIFEEKNDDGLYYTWMPIVPYVILNRQDSQDTGRVYQLKEGANLNVSYGKQCQKKDEAMLSYQTALYYAKIYGYDDVEKLLNQEISFYQTIDNGIIIDSPYRLKVTGILTESNRYEYQIFTANGVFDNLQSEVFNVPIEKWVYDYVDFMVDPQSSIGEVIEKINTIYQGKQSNFDRKAYGEISSFDLRLAGAVSPNTLPEIDVISLVKVSLIVIIMTIVIYAIIESFFLTRRKKENDILKRYQYNVIIVTCVKNFIFLLMIGLIFVIFGRYICEAINSIVNVIFRSYNTKNTIVILDYMSLTASLGICFTLIFIEEVIFNGISTRKHN